MRRIPETGRLLTLAAITATVVAAVACGRAASKSKTVSSPTGGGSSVAARSADAGTNAQTLGSAGGPDAQRASAVAPAPSGAAASSGDASVGAPSDSGALPLPDVLDRKVIMVSTVSLTVENVARGFEDVGNIATVEGGFVADSAFGHQGDKETASVMIRVPSDRYQDALARVRKLGDVQDEQTNSNDVTQDYTDLQSRLRSLQAALQQYLQFLSRAGDIGQVLQVQDRINQTQAEIEQTQGRINLLDNQTGLATITAHLEPVVAKANQPKPGGPRNPLEVAADAFAASLAVLKGIATVTLAVAAFSWWLVPLAAAGWYVGRRQLKADRERRAVPPPPPAAV